MADKASAGMDKLYYYVRKTDKALELSLEILDGLEYFKEDKGEEEEASDDNSDDSDDDNEANSDDNSEANSDNVDDESDDESGSDSDDDVKPPPLHQSEQRILAEEVM